MAICRRSSEYSSCRDAQIEFAFQYAKNGWLNLPNFEFEKDGERIVLLCLADKQRKKQKKKKG